MLFLVNTDMHLCFVVVACYSCNNLAHGYVGSNFKFGCTLHSCGYVVSHFTNFFPSFRLQFRTRAKLRNFAMNDSRNGGMVFPTRRKSICGSSRASHTPSFQNESLSWWVCVGSRSIVSSFAQFSPINFELQMHKEPPLSSSHLSHE